MSNRVLKINSLLKEELSKIISREIDFPEGVLATITRIETSANLFEAKVYVSLLGEGQTDKILEILNRNIYNIQQILNKRLKMRPIPKIIFKREEKTKEAARVEELLNKLKKA